MSDGGTKVCAVCGKYFTPTKSTQKYCDECRKNGLRKKGVADRHEKISAAKYCRWERLDRGIENKCCHCGKVFRAPTVMNYCSTACHDEYWAEKAVCAHCGAKLLELGIKARFGQTHIYCSEQCREQHRWQRARAAGKIGICQHCGKEYIKGGEMYCSRVCADADRHTARCKHMPEPMQPARTVRRVCEYCGKTYYEEMDEFAFPVSYCSPECSHAASIREHEAELEEKAAAKAAKEMERLKKSGLCASCKVSYTACIRMTSNFKYSPDGASFDPSGRVIVRCPLYRGKFETIAHSDALMKG